MTRNEFKAKYNLDTSTLSKIEDRYAEVTAPKKYNCYVAHATTHQPILTGPFEMFAEAYCRYVIPLEENIKAFEKRLLEEGPLL